MDITELLRNGDSLPEAKELARHSDVNQTMRYTHIGLSDQAKALAQLPAPPNGLKPTANATQGTKPALHGRCISGGFAGPDASPSDAHPNAANGEKPCDTMDLDAICRPVSLSDKMGPLGLEPRTHRL
jgi:hypothetical protein